MDDDDRKDTRSARTILLALAILGTLWILAAALAAWQLPAFTTASVQGVGWQDGAIWAFLVTTTLLVVLALVAGDGIVGEVQFLLLGFFLLFAVSWPMIVFLF